MIGNVLRRHIVSWTVTVAAVSLIAYLNIGCPFLRLTGLPCPTCGVTRAMIAIVSGNIYDYCRYQPLALPLVVSVLLMLHISRFRRKGAVVVFSVGTAVVNLIVYFHRIR